MLIKIGACLKNCSPCNSAPFATFNGEVITAKSWRELMRRYLSLSAVQTCSYLLKKLFCSQILIKGAPCHVLFTTLSSACCYYL